MFLNKTISFLILVIFLFISLHAYAGKPVDESTTTGPPSSSGVIVTPPTTQQQQPQSQQQTGGGVSILPSIPDIPEEFSLKKNVFDVGANISFTFRGSQQIPSIGTKVGFFVLDFLQIGFIILRLCSSLLNDFI